MLFSATATRERASSARGPRVKKIWVVLLVTAALLGSLSIPGLRPSDLMLRYWQHQIAHGDEDQIAVRIAQIAQLDETGIPFLTRLLSSSQEAVFQATRQSLHARLTDWKSLPLERSGPKVDCLAAALVEHLPDYHPAAQQAAAELARRIANWPKGNGKVDVTVRLAACERIMRHVADQRPPDQVASRSPVEHPAHLLAQRRSPRAPSGEIADTLPSELPGGDLRVEPVKLPAAPPSLGGPALSPIDPDQPPELQPTQIPEPEAFEPDRPELLYPGRSGASLQVTPRPPSVSPPRPEVGPVDGPAEPQTLPSSDGRQPPLPLRSLRDREVLHQLQSVDPDTVQAAAQELVRRGFTASELRLGKWLFDPDPVVRQQLVEVLPSLNLDASRWLMWLSHDEHPEVRRVSVGLMATSRDARLQQRLREMYQSETNPRVLEPLRTALRGN